MQFMMYPGEFHYFDREHVLRDAWRRVDEFFAANLRGCLLETNSHPEARHERVQHPARLQINWPITADLGCNCVAVAQVKQIGDQVPPSSVPAR